MPYLKNDNLKLHYTDSSPSGGIEAIITLHGLSESHLYWALPGITDRLVKAGYRVIGMDMRGHGFTRVEGAEKGYDVHTISEDIGRLADHLQLEKFHLLTHATGGIAGFRYAMEHSERLLSVMATDTGSATFPSDQYSDAQDLDRTYPPISDVDLKRNNALIGTFRGNSWGIVVNGTRLSAAKNPFLSGLLAVDNPESAFAMYTACSAIGDPDDIAAFVEGFYMDYDPCIAGLRKITCPTLMLLGEYDRMFIKPAQLVARNIPACKHVVMKGIGHMTAIEDPVGLGDELLAFLKGL